MKRIILLSISLLFFFGVFAKNTLKNYVFAQRDSCSLTMDVYTPENVHENTPCLIFVFGGGFKMGSKSNSYNTPYLKAMADSGFVVISIDYRLGMKGVRVKGKERLQTIKKAIDMAVEDLFCATNYILNNASTLNIDPTKIIISGSSAGAVTVLQADYELANRTKIAEALPANFRFAGVISFAGGILSFNGEPTYKETPAPTLFFHGTEDHLVRYDKIQVLQTGFFGTNTLVKQFEKFDYPYFAYRYRDMGHEIAGIPMNLNRSEICTFIHDYVLNKLHLKKDMTVKNPYLKKAFYGKWKPKDLYK